MDFSYKQTDLNPMRVIGLIDNSATQLYGFYTLFHFRQRKNNLFMEYRDYAIHDRIL
jgi:hypothetical protein